MLPAVFSRGARLGLVALALACAAAGAQPVATPYDNLGAEQQVRLLSRQMAQGAFEKTTDAELLAALAALHADAWRLWASTELAPFSEYEFAMTRQERVNGQWQAQPARMSVRYRHSPRQIQARWLPGGARAGQSLWYDETQRPDQMYGNLGGLLGFASMWVALDSPLARAQSNHTVRDLGLQYIAALLDQNARSLRAMGRTEKPTQITLVQETGQRMVAVTWELPSGPPQFYAKKVQLVFDLKNPWPRVVTTWNKSGEMTERMVFENVVAKPLDAKATELPNSDKKF